MQIRVNDIIVEFSDRGTGLPIVFLHAFPLNRTMWEEQASALSDSFRTITIDLRGHGGSDAPLWHYSMRQMADDVCAVLDSLTIDRALFVGLSMGGYILFALQRAHSHRIMGMVLADTRAQADPPVGQAGRFQMAQTAYKNGAAAVAELMLPKLLSPATRQNNPALVRRVRAMIEGNQVSGIAGALMAMAERQDSVDVLPQIRCPVQLIVGELDAPTPPADAQFMADRIPDAVLEVIPGAAPLSNLEQPQPFTRILGSFAARIAASDRF